MKIYYFANTANPNTASTRYRGTYLLGEMKNTRGVEHSIHHPDIYSFLKIIFLILKNIFQKDTKNAYIVQKVSAPGKYSWLLGLLLKTVTLSFYDLDDAMYEIRNKKTVDYFIQNCSGCIAASRNLLEYCLKLNKNSILITSPVPSPTAVKFQKNKEGFTLGWIGIYKTVHKESLEKILFPVLKKVPCKVRLMLLGVQDSPEENLIKEILRPLENVHVIIIRKINWNDESKINSYLCQFDVGLMPLCDNEINRSKSAFKIKQYLACGIPTLASPVGENNIFTQNGKTGFLFASPEEWISHINFFYHLDQRAYSTFAKNCHTHFLEGDFTLAFAAKELIHFIEKTREGVTEDRKRLH